MFIDKKDKLNYLLYIYQNFRTKCLEYFKQEDIHQDLVNEFERIFNKSVENIKLAYTDNSLVGLYNDFCQSVTCTTADEYWGIILFDDIEVCNENCDAIRDSLNILSEAIFGWCGGFNRDLQTKHIDDFKKILLLDDKYDNRNEQQERPETKIETRSYLEFLDGRGIKYTISYTENGTPILKFDDPNFHP